MLHISSVCDSLLHLTYQVTIEQNQLTGCLLFQHAFSMTIIYINPGNCCGLAVTVHDCQQQKIQQNHILQINL